MDIERSDESLEDMTALDKSVARRVKQTVERFAEPGAGSVKALRATHPPEFRLRVGDWRVRFHQHGDWINVLRVRNRKDAYR